MSPLHGRTPLVFVALVGFAGCGGSLAPPDGAGSGGDGNGSYDGGIVAACETPIPLHSVAGMPCTFPIPAPPCDAVDAGHIGVVVNGVEIPHDTSHTNGWDYTSAAFTEVGIYGPTCDALTSGTPTVVNIVFKILI